MQRSVGGRRLFALVAVVAATVLAAAPVTVAPAASAASSASAAAAASAAPLPGCTNAPPATTDLTPIQLRQRDGLDPLLAAGHDGRGQTAALIEVASSVDQVALDDFAACFGSTAPPLVQRALPGQTVPPPSPTFKEAQGDAESLVSGAPGLDRIYVIVVADIRQDLAAAAKALVDGSLTDGQRVDVVSLSFGPCFPTWQADEIAASEAALQQVADAGIWFFKAAGDAGPSDCSPHPTCVPKDAGPAMGYPASSPWVTAVGGTMLEQGLLGPPKVWNAHEGDPNDCSAGAGGLADATTFPRPAFQDVVPSGQVPTSRGLPDVVALAGYPNYLNLESGGGWVGNAGTSLAAPFYAGAMASVRSALRHAGLAHPVHLNDALYALAADPATYAAAFVDVTTKGNDIYGVGCCTAGVGFDLASGLGELRIDVVAAQLAAVAPPLPTTSTSTSPTSTSTSTTTPTGTVTPAFTG